MKQYKPKDNDTLRCSNLKLGLMRDFYNKGHYKTYPVDEGLFADQRVFGPCEAQGLIANDGRVWYITEAGIAWWEHMNGRTAWKDHASRAFSHYIKIQRTRTKLELVKKGPGQETGRERRKVVGA